MQVLMTRYREWGEEEEEKKEEEEKEEKWPLTTLGQPQKSKSLLGKKESHGIY